MRIREMRIGEMSRRCGISVRMLRYYESQKVLSPQRTASGYRLYGDVDVETIERVMRLQAAGLTLPAIRKLLPCARRDGPGFHPCDVVKQGLRRKLVDLDHKIAALSESRRLIDDYLSDAERAGRS